MGHTTGNDAKGGGGGGLLGLIVATAAALFAGWSAWEAHETRVGADQSAAESLTEIRLARTAAEASAQAARETARATSQLVQVGRTTNQVLLIINNFGFGDNEQAKTPISFGMTFKNPTTNTTPAKNMSGELWYGLGPPAADIAPSAPKQHISYSELGPGETWSIYVAPAIPRPSDAQLDQLRNGSLKLVAVGFLNYDDLYGNKHTRRWCYEFVRGGQNGVSECPTGNSSN